MYVDDNKIGPIVKLGEYDNIDINSEKERLDKLLFERFSDIINVELKKVKDSDVVYDVDPKPVADGNMRITKRYVWLEKLKPFQKSKLNNAKIFFWIFQGKGGQIWLLGEKLTWRKSWWRNSFTGNRSCLIRESHWQPRYFLYS